MRDQYIVRACIACFIIISLSACKKEKSIYEGNRSQLAKQLVVKNNTKISIESDVHPKSWQIHVKEKNDSTYIIRKNYLDNSIIEYNWESGKLVNVFKFKREGPNEVDKFDSSGFKEIRDSTFIIGTGRSQVYIVKNDSVLFHDYYDDDGYGFGMMLNGFNKNLPVKIGNKVYMFRKPPVARTEDSYYTYDLLVNFDLESKVLTECSVTYPESYKIGECWSFEHLRQSFTLNNKNELIFSFPIDPFLYRYSITDDTFEKIEKSIKSQYATDFDKMSCNPDKAVEKYMYNMKKSARYESISYDKYRDQYYRTLLLPPKDLITKNAEEIQMRLSIMVLDKDFNIISEDILPENTYDYEDFFISPEGFWISRNNRGNEEFDEDYMDFDLLVLADKE